MAVHHGVAPHSHRIFGVRVKTPSDTGLGEEVDRWAARLSLCQGVEPPSERHFDIERARLCRNMERACQQVLERVMARYGADSEQVTYLRSTARDHGLSD
jgi:hypothetical protein